MRSGGPGRIKHATEQDWADGIRRLQDVHNFGECSGSKKFYRADHFQQHLRSRLPLKREAADILVVDA